MKRIQYTRVATHPLTLSEYLTAREHRLATEIASLQERITETQAELDKVMRVKTALMKDAA